MAGKKKSGKKGKKGGGGGEKKKKEPVEVVTFKEAVMMYQVEVKQRSFDDLKEDMEDLKYRNEKQKKRNHFLKKEQNRHIKDVISQAREKEQELQNEKQTPFEDVEGALEEKRNALMMEQSNIEDLKENIKTLGENIVQRTKDLNGLIYYRDHGQTIDRTHISLLKKDMTDMEESYTEMAEFFEKSLAAVKLSIKKQNEENINKEKILASERAIDKLDKHTEQEFLDNKWLHKEVEINRQHISLVENNVEMLEKMNIDDMSDLFENQLQDLNDTRKFYIACKDDDFQRLHSSNVGCITTDDSENGDDDDDDDYDSDIEEIIEQDGNINGTEELPDDLKWIDEYLPELEQIPNDDDYRLGPMEVKLLCVTGKKATLNHWTEDCETHDCNKEPYKQWIVERDEISRVGSDL